MAKKKVAKVVENTSTFWNENCAVCNKLGKCDMEEVLRSYKDGGMNFAPVPKNPMVLRIGMGDCAEIEQGVTHKDPEKEAAEMADELALVMEKMSHDHERLARIESMLQFLLEKSFIEIDRKPYPDEKLRGETSRVKFRRTYWEEWSEAWKKRLKERQKEEEANGKKKDSSQRN